MIKWIVFYLLISFIGGIIAYIKNDYFTRGFFICFFTGIFGIIAMLFSPKSKAKEGNEGDEHSWPKYGGIALLAAIVSLLFLLFTKYLLNH